jgi:hypothetical protein
MPGEQHIFTVERVQQVIYLIRGQKVMLDYELADLYGVPTKVLKQAVRRNIDRFPSDFMFELTNQEFTNLRSQIVTSSLPQWGGTRYKPMAFTQEGVAMLSGVLHSARAVQVNIAIMRAFVRLREALSASKDLARTLAELERRIASHDASIQTLFQAIRQLMTPSESSRKKIGFTVKEKGAVYKTKKGGRKGSILR